VTVFQYLYLTNSVLTAGGREPLEQRVSIILLPCRLYYGAEVIAVICSVTRLVRRIQQWYVLCKECLLSIHLCGGGVINEILFVQTRKEIQ
jgi:hypothetical protein